MLPDRVSNPGPLTYESGALPIALRGPACMCVCMCVCVCGRERERERERGGDSVIIYIIDKLSERACSVKAIA